MKERPNTVCVGRFLIDVPASATVSLSHEMLDGFAIDSVVETEASFRQRIAAREAEIAARSVDVGVHGPGGMVEARDLPVHGMAGRTFIFGRYRTYGFEWGRRVEDEWVSVESHAHIAGTSFSLSMQYANDTDASQAESLLSRLHLRGENEIPDVSGFCVARGMFVEPLPSHQTEHIAMHVGFPGHPDLALAFASLPGGARARGLLKRYADMDEETDADEFLRITKLRSGRRDFNGAPGEEVLERVREFNFATTYGFMWETQGATDDPLRPFLSLEMHGGLSKRPGGPPSDTSLDKVAMLDLWDNISSTIRVHETAHAVLTRRPVQGTGGKGRNARVQPAKLGQKLP